jgi:hypothetical protein
MKLLIKLIAMAALLFLAMMVSHFLIYKALIVPQLPNLRSVPLSWWTGAFAPVLFVFLIFGISLKSWRELILFSILAAFVQKIFGYLMSTWNEVGHLKSFEAPIFDWTVGLVVGTVMSAVLFTVGFATGKALKSTPKLH